MGECSIQVHKKYEYQSQRFYGKILFSYYCWIYSIRRIKESEEIKESKEIKESDEIKISEDIIESEEINILEDIIESEEIKKLEESNNEKK